MNEDLIRIAEAVRSGVAAVPLSERGRILAMGADGTPTSHIDKVAEDIIIGYLEDRAIPLNLLSEEAGFLNRGYQETLVADPVDGTHNACAGIPFYNVSLAVGRDSLGGITEALVMNLVTGDVYTASKGKGAFLNGSPIRVRVPGKEMLLMAYLGAAAVPRTHEIASRFKRVRCLGSVALEICSVASGTADAFFIEYSEIKKSPRIVDIAAAVLILREAGGEAYGANRDILDMPLSLEARSNVAAAGSKAALELIS
ncbi:MAG: inositol monophosphatase [Thermoplasmata archaeon]|nr:inositol monophosphatase [Thermoplasmata archaeon]